MNCQESIKLGKAVLSKIRAAIIQALEHEGIPHCVEISLMLTDDEGIRELNRQYRDKDKATDVLSFPNFEKDEVLKLKSEGKKAKDLFETGATNAYLGDIAISMLQATKQAEEEGHSLEAELAVLTVHSILHLVGYDHEKDENEALLMFDVQTTILSQMGVAWRWEQ